MQAGSTARYAERAIWQGLWRAMVALLVVSLTSCGPSVLNPRGYVGEANRQILLDSLGIMLAIVVPVLCATAGVAWWFRASNSRARYRPDFVYSGEIELVVWSIPLLTIMLLGGVAWVASHDLDPAAPLPSKAEPLPVQVVSLDWKWLFIYPDQGIASVNRLVVPTSVPIHFVLTSASVMNVFFIPQLGTMIYTMNGMANRLNLIADHAGTYYGQSAMISGDGFPTMHFDVDAVSAEQFAAWVNKTKADGPTLDRRTYGELARQSMSVQPFTYRTVEPDLFRKIVTQDVPPGPGPGTSAAQSISDKAHGG